MLPYFETGIPDEIDDRTRDEPRALTLFFPATPTVSPNEPLGDYAAKRTFSIFSTQVYNLFNPRPSDSWTTGDPSRVESGTF